MPRRRNQGGYALLAVLFFGAVMAITFAISLPRAAFEAQRQIEDDLVYRGSQYSRAVQLYYRKFKTYPSKIEDLEKGRNIRFLRRKYVDPITKKDEWRFIHIGPAGVFSDSLVYDRPKKPKEGEEAAGAGGFPATPHDAVPGQGQGQAVTGMADRLRANVQPGQITAGEQSPQQPGYYNAGQPGGVPLPATGAPFAGGPGQPPRQPGMPGGGPFVPGQQPGAFGQPTGFGQQPTGFGQQQTGFGQQQTGFGQQSPGGFGQRQPSAFGQQQPGAFGQQQPGAFGQQQPGAFGQPVPQPVPGSGQSAFGQSPGLGSEAARIIGSLLTTPRPGGLQGVPGGQPGSLFGTPAGGMAGAGASFGGGIAGVASKSEARGIKIVNERENYNEWEFVYDYRKDPLVMGAMGAAGMQPGMQQGMQPGMQPGMLGQQPGAFGQQPGAFGQQPGAFGQPGGPMGPINPSQPGLPGSPFGPAGGGRPTVLTPGPPPRR